MMYNTDILENNFENGKVNINCNKTVVLVFLKGFDGDIAYCGLIRNVHVLVKLCVDNIMVSYILRSFLFLCG